MPNSEAKKAWNREYMRSYTQSDEYKERKRAYDRERYQQRKADTVEREKIRASQNESNRKRRANPVTHQAERKRERELMKDPPRLAKKAARNKLRRESKRRATPAWISPRQVRQMEAFYLTRPVGWHVDHIVPLRGENVCGLHVPWNLQHLPSTDNMQKGNRYAH